MTQQHTNRLKRNCMRSWRRGTKEMDLILGPYADKCLDTLTDTELLSYENLLSEDDHDLYKWVSGQLDAPLKHGVILKKIKDFHRM